MAHGMAGPPSIERGRSEVLVSAVVGELADDEPAFGPAREVEPGPVARWWRGTAPTSQ
jgi:hypothetical protein